jgi:putative nucleotide binding protein
MEDYVHILDYLPKGRPDAPPARREPTLLGVGETQFTLFELAPKKGASFTIGDRAYVGKDVEQRTLVQKIRGRVKYEELTPAAHGELPYVIEDIMKHQPERFVKFFNEAPAISVRYHALELLPGIGKKSVEHILNERRQKTFESFEDIEERAHIQHPQKVIIQRIVKELSYESEKYHIFVRPPAKDEPHGHRGRGRY